MPCVWAAQPSQPAPCLAPCMGHDTCAPYTSELVLCVLPHRDIGGQGCAEARRASSRTVARRRPAPPSSGRRGYGARPGHARLRHEFSPRTPDSCAAAAELGYEGGGCVVCARAHPPHAALRHGTCWRCVWFTGAATHPATGSAGCASAWVIHMSGGLAGATRGSLVRAASSRRPRRLCPRPHTPHQWHRPSHTEQLERTRSRPTACAL